MYFETTVYLCVSAIVFNISSVVSTQQNFSLIVQKVNGTASHGCLCGVMTQSKHQAGSHIITLPGVRQATRSLL